VLTADEVGAADAEQNDWYDEEGAFLREDQLIIEEPEEPAEPQHHAETSATAWLYKRFWRQAFTGFTISHARR